MAKLRLCLQLSARVCKFFVMGQILVDCSTFAMIN